MRRFQAQRHDESGFTLIELLVVMILVGVLTAIAVPSMLNSQKKSRSASAKSDARAISLVIQRLLLDQLPTADVAITSSAGTYSIASTPATTGTLASGNSVGANSKYTAAGTYCIAVTSSDSNTFRLTDTITTPTSGGC